MFTKRIWRVTLSPLVFVAFLSFFLVSFINMTLCSRERRNWYRIESSVFYLIKVLANLPTDALWGKLLMALITSLPH